MASLFGVPLTMSFFLDVLKLIFPLLLPVLAYRIKRGSKATFLQELKEVEAEMVETQEKVEAEEDLKNRRRTAIVKLWMEDADLFLENEVHHFRHSCVYSVPLLCDARCWLADLVNHTRELKTRRRDIGASLVGERPLKLPVEDPRPWIVGGKETLDDIRRHLENDEVQIVGVHGMAGIGKTAYLKVIAHEEWEKLEKRNEGAGNDATGERRTHGMSGLCTTIWSKAITCISKLWKGASSASQNNRREADDGRPADDGQGVGVVIWAAISEQNPVPNLLKAIGDQLFSLSTADALEVSAARIRGKLEEKQFILLLDGVQEGLKWEDIGIPSPQPGSKSKIVFTARSWETCKVLQARELVKVNLLKKDEPWTLFKNTVLEENLGDTCMEKVARALAAKCGGLPDALETVARAMRRCSTIVQWEDASALWNAPVTRNQPGMDDVFDHFAVCFKKLKTYLTQLRSSEACLLYCYLFPEDQAIHAERLVNYWIGEGRLDSLECKWNVVRRRGYEEIKKLVRDSSLVSCGDDEREVLLHDVVRRTTMWMTGGGEGNRSNIYLTSAVLKLSRDRHFIAWRDAERISYMGSEEVSLSDHGEMQECPRLLTLLLNEDGNTLPNQNLGRLLVVPENFFQSISKLRVLDLSGLNLCPFPAGIDALVELSYLNLSYTNITELPGGLKRLKKLRKLNLRGTSCLSGISHNSISKYGLQALDLFRSGVNIRYGELRCLEEFKDLSELGISLKSSYFYLEKLLDKFSTSTVFLELYNVVGLLPHHLPDSFSKMENLRELYVRTRLRMEFSIATGQLPKLEVLSLENVVITIAQDAEGTLLKSLRRLHIIYRVLEELKWVHHLLDHVVISPTGPGVSRPMRLDGFKALLNRQTPSGSGGAASSAPVAGDHVTLPVD